MRSINHYRFAVCLILQTTTNYRLFVLIWSPVLWKGHNLRPFWWSAVVLIIFFCYKEAFVLIFSLFHRSFKFLGVLFSQVLLRNQMWFFRAATHGNWKENWKPRTFRPQSRLKSHHLTSGCLVGRHGHFNFRLYCRMERNNAWEIEKKLEEENKKEAKERKGERKKG